MTIENALAIRLNFRIVAERMASFNDRPNPFVA
jgi:hypothetical protein